MVSCTMVTTDDSPSQAALDWVMRLVSLDTTSRDSNLPLIEVVAQEIRACGIEPVLVPNDTGTKANLIATFPADDGSTEGGIVLSGHTDVVPVDGQDWSSDPFTPQTRDGRLYGRGTCDMKSFIGVVASRLSEIAAAPLREPIHLALSYDEEVGCVGAVDLVKDLVGRGLRPRACIVGEPSSMRAVRGHKSMNVIRVDFHGVAAHSSLTPRGVNAIEYAAAFVRFVRAVAEGFRDHGPYDDAFDVPYTTCSVNVVSGGIAVNTVPADATAVFEFRTIAADDPSALLDRFRSELDGIERLMQQENGAARIELTVLAQAPGLDTALDAQVVDLVTGWGGEASSAKVAYGTEAGLFDQAGIPTVVCGPGDIAQAHAPDEFVALEQIARCERMIDALIADLRA